jgi:hypothetical protein
MSAEARIGTGITIAMIGLLFVMLGWAQHMREVKEAAFILLAIGAVLLVAGAIAAISGGVTKLRATDFQRQ